MDIPSAQQIALVLALWVPSAMCGQLPSAQRTPVTPTQAMSEMREALLQVVWGQEVFWAQHRRYSTDLIAVRAGMKTRPAKGVILTIHYADERSWTASAEHLDLPKRSCVIAAGETEDHRLPATLKDRAQVTSRERGMPLCDEL